MESKTFIKLTVAICLLTAITAASAYAESFTFNVVFDGTDYSFGSGLDPLSTDLNVGDDITYILTAADNDYWQTTTQYAHFAFLSVTAPATGTRVSIGMVTYSLNGFEVGASILNTETLAESIVGGIYTVPYLSQFDTITITSYIDSETENDSSPFRIDDYQITDFNDSWVEYIHNDLPGDVNWDDQVDLTDAILSLQVISGIVTTGVYSSGDVNNDGMIGLPEVIYILQYLATP